MITTAFFDPSARSGKQHDFKAIIVGSLISAIYYVRYAFIRRCTVQEVLEQLYLIEARFPGMIIGFEENGFQVLYKDLLDYKAKEKGYPIRIHGMTSTGNKEARIEGLSGFVENGSILFQKDEKGYTSDIGILVEQMLDFPNGAHDDGPDALKYAFDLARDKARKGAFASVRKEGRLDEARKLRRQFARPPRIDGRSDPFAIEIGRSPKKKWGKTDIEIEESRQRNGRHPRGEAHYRRV